MRINGSHLKRKHNINIDEYKNMFPNADCGRYKVNNFNCKNEKEIEEKCLATVDAGYEIDVWILDKKTKNVIKEFKHD